MMGRFTTHVKNIFMFWVKIYHQVFIYLKILKIVEFFAYLIPRSMEGKKNHYRLFSKTKVIKMKI